MKDENDRPKATKKRKLNEVSETQVVESEPVESVPESQNLA
jgi:hypothetical protein